MSEASKPTPGPWFSDREGRIWRRPPADLYENGGGVAGDRPIAVAEKGWYGKDEMGYPVEANATLIAEAGTVHHETGLTPRQLVEQRDALAAVLAGLDEAYCRAGAPLSRDERAEDRKRLIAARTALAMVKGATP